MDGSFNSRIKPLTNKDSRTTPCITLSEVTQRKTKTNNFTYMWDQKNQTHSNRVDRWLPGVPGGRNGVILV